MYVTSTHTNDECRGVQSLEDSRRLITAAVVATLSCRTVVQFTQLYQYLLRDQHYMSSPLHLLSCFQSSSHIIVYTKTQFSTVRTVVLITYYHICELKTINKLYILYFLLTKLSETIFNTSSKHQYSTVKFHKEQTEQVNITVTKRQICLNTILYHRLSIQVLMVFVYIYYVLIIQQIKTPIQ